MRKEGVSRGFGFVTFADTIPVEKVMVQKQIINDRVIDCKRATPKEAGGGGGGYGDRGGYGGGGRGGYGESLSDYSQVGPGCEDDNGSYIGLLARVTHAGSLVLSGSVILCMKSDSSDSSLKLLPLPLPFPCL
jgi:hypothetical protein